MTRLYVALAVCGVCAIGYFSLRAAHRRLLATMSLTADFLQHLQRFLQTRAADSENYSWLLRNSYELQANMGEFGIMGQFHAAYSRQIVQNWPIVINSLPAMRRSLERDFGSGTEEFIEYGALMQEAILRYVGPLENQDREARSQLKNPVIWFRYGIQWLIFSPFTILRWLGIHSIPEQGKLGRNPVLRFLSIVASIVAFVSTLVTIIAGWDHVKLFLDHLHR
jgi:hypothetical protein